MSLNKRISVMAMLCVTMAACAQNTEPPAPAAGTEPPAAVAPPLMADLLQDVEGVEQKLLDLAGAMPEGTMKWTPGPGVRSVREVILHVASDNYLLPSLFGTPIPAETKIAGADSTLGIY